MMKKTIPPPGGHGTCNQTAKYFNASDFAGDEIIAT